MRMKEIVNKNYKVMELVTKNISKELPAVYGIRKFKGIMPYNLAFQPIKFVYIGSTFDIHRRWWVDHQKPSMDLMTKIVFDVVGKYYQDYGHENYMDYFNQAKLLIQDYECVILKDFSYLKPKINNKTAIRNFKQKMTNYEKILIDHYKPKFNKQTIVL